jgi:hypothetical protein
MNAANLAGLLPHCVLVVATGAFGGWVAYDALASTPGGRPREIEEGVLAVPAQLLRPEATPTDPQLESAKPGAQRLFIERQFASLERAVVDPVDTSGDTPVLRTRYQVHLERAYLPLMPDASPVDFRPGLYWLVLEFDGSERSQPLIRAELTPVLGRE